MTKMTDLYPDGAGYHQAHDPYIAAVAKAVAAVGYPVDDWSAEPNDPRDGYIGLNVDLLSETSTKAIWTNEEVNLAWTEDRGWALVTVTESHRSDGRFVYDLPVARVASPSTMAFALAEQVGDDVTVQPDNHPDLDFDHSFEDDDVPFELALRHYAEKP
ncbi:hypothetical protein Ade02nite_21020 [Paractinoplanes deccanensis]|uniref:DUF6292 domain-containing protein n=1 Tax=Paractinoplanes deccanensis TaxID=113561 RepID=A0ABQ3Y0D7_9ACTN|nr:DUF6292 family protein [Actinoplanes deccanensis]GID73461.1 hypothetical protein Ade02nite_21020 [Actinoplanes deccanensis]